jgi:hypothetical protein
MSEKEISMANIQVSERTVAGNTHSVGGLRWHTCGMHKNFMTNADKDYVERVVDKARKNYLESVR